MLPILVSILQACQNSDIILDKISTYTTDYKKNMHRKKSNIIHENYTKRTAADISKMVQVFSKLKIGKYCQIRHQKHWQFWNAYSLMYLDTNIKADNWEGATNSQ